jgi:hypothetical protein
MIIFKIYLDKMKNFMKKSKRKNNGIKRKNKDKKFEKLFD